jgi:hypothetical protein
VRHLLVGLALASVACQALLVETSKSSDSTAGDAGSGADGGSERDGQAEKDANGDATPDAVIARCVGATNGSVFLDNFEGSLDRWSSHDQNPTNIAMIDPTVAHGVGRSLLSQFTRAASGECRSARVVCNLEGSFTQTHVSFWVLLTGPSEFGDDYAVEQGVENGPLSCRILTAFRYDPNTGGYNIHLLAKRVGAADEAKATQGTVAANQWTNIDMDVDHATGQTVLHVAGAAVFADAFGNCSSASPANATASVGITNCPGLGTPNTIRIHFDDVLIEAH